MSKKDLIEMFHFPKTQIVIGTASVLAAFLAVPACTTGGPASESEELGRAVAANSYGLLKCLSSQTPNVFKVGQYFYHTSTGKAITAGAPDLARPGTLRAILSCKESLQAIKRIQQQLDTVQPGARFIFTDALKELERGGKLNDVVRGQLARMGGGSGSSAANVLGRTVVIGGVAISIFSGAMDATAIAAFPSPPSAFDSYTARAQTVQQALQLAAALVNARLDEAAAAARLAAWNNQTNIDPWCKEEGRKRLQAALDAARANIQALERLLAGLPGWHYKDPALQDAIAQADAWIAFRVDPSLFPPPVLTPPSGSGTGAGSGSSVNAPPVCPSTDTFDVIGSCTPDLGEPWCYDQGTGSGSDGGSASGTTTGSSLLL